MWMDQRQPEETEQPSTVLSFNGFFFLLNWILFQMDVFPGTFYCLNPKNYWTV